jgi:hypothetical protein
MQPFLLSRTYVFAAFGGRWPGVAFPNCGNCPVAGNSKWATVRTPVHCVHDSHDGTAEETEVIAKTQYTG